MNTAGSLHCSLNYNHLRRQLRLSYHPKSLVSIMQRTVEAWRADAAEGVDLINTAAIVQTRAGGTVVHILLTHAP